MPPLDDPLLDDVPDYFVVHHTSPASACLACAQDQITAQMRRSSRQPQGDRVQQNVEAKMRQFSSGATRHSDADKLDYEGFLSPLVLRRFAEYMHKNRVQADGELRSSDNWQKGIPPEAYMKSLLRHVMDTWAIHRGQLAFRNEADLEEALCGVLFNAMGYLHELCKTQN